MIITNNSRKIIGIAGEPLLPGSTVQIPDEYIYHPSIQDYIKKGAVSTDRAGAAPSASKGISDAEREEIEQAAVARYLEEQARAKDIEAVRSMKKADLLAKAAELGIDTSDGNVDAVKDKVIAALSGQGA